MKDYWLMVTFCLCFNGVLSQFPDFGNITTSELVYEDCDMDNEIGKFRFWMDPNPVKVPSPDAFSFNWELTFHEDLTEPLDMKMDFLKKIPLLFGMVSWLRVPCIVTPIISFGSCHFKDLCENKDYPFKMCIDPKTEKEYECGCPTFKKGTYLIKPMMFEFTEMPPGIPQYLLDGEMHMSIALVTQKKNISCSSAMVYTKTSYPEEDDQYL